MESKGTNQRNGKPVDFDRPVRMLEFQSGGQLYALDTGAVERLLPMAELQRPPGTPAVITGFLNVAGEFVAVLSLQRLFGSECDGVRRWTPLVLLKSRSPQIALLVDCVTRVFTVCHKALRPVPAGHVVNDCVQGMLRDATASVLVLSADRLLMQKEQRVVTAICEQHQVRLRELEGAVA